MDSVVSVERHSDRVLILNVVIDNGLLRASCSKHGLGLTIRLTLDL